MAANKDSGLVRCFIALDLPEEMIEGIAKVQDELKKHNLFQGRYTQPENIHLTLKFLGEISDGKVNEVRRRLGEIGLRDFSATIGKIGVFSEKYVRVVWLTLEGEKVFKLQKDVDNVLQDLFEKEQRFMSHITIARVKNVKDKKSLLDFLRGLNVGELLGREKEVAIRSFSLYKSTLTPSGPVYELIEKYHI